jgi:hypothetical protein
LDVQTKETEISTCELVGKPMVEEEGRGVRANGSRAGEVMIEALLVAAWRLPRPFDVQVLLSTCDGEGGES